MRILQLLDTEYVRTNPALTLFLHINNHSSKQSKSFTKSQGIQIKEGFGRKSIPHMS